MKMDLQRRSTCESKFQTKNNLVALPLKLDNLNLDLICNLDRPELNFDQFVAEKI